MYDTEKPSFLTLEEYIGPIEYDLRPFSPLEIDRDYPVNLKNRILFDRYKNNLNPLNNGGYLKA